MAITLKILSYLLTRELDEDRIKIEQTLNEEKQVSYFAVFDGHKGEEIAEELKNELHRKVRL